MFPLFAAASLLLNLAAVSPAAGNAAADDSAAPKPPPEWLKRLDAGTPGAFPPSRPFAANYRITWLGVKAAEVEVKSSLAENGSQIRTSLKASTVGGPRNLWQLDATHTAWADRATLRPIRLEQSDKREKKHVNSRVEFSSAGALRWMQTLTKDNNFATPAPDSEEAAKKPRVFPYPGLVDLHCAFLYLRSQPLNAGETHTLAVMSATNPYLVTVKVLGRETIKVPAGRYAAIKLSLGLEKIGKTGAVETHKGFKSATIWVSDDTDRLALKVAAQVFIGSVSLELEKAAFP